MKKILILTSVMLLGVVAMAQQKSLTPEDLQRLNNGDRIIADMMFTGEDGTKNTLWIVVSSDGNTAYPYWNNPPLPDHIKLKDNNENPNNDPVEIQVVCGRVYCCYGHCAHNGRVCFCDSADSYRWRGQ